MGIGRVRPGIGGNLRRRLHVGQRAVEEVVVETAFARLSPTHTVLVGELAIVARIANLEMPAGWVGRTRGHDADVGAEKVLQIATRPGQTKPNLGDVRVGRQPQVLAQAAVGDVMAAGHEGAAVVVGHPIRLAMVECGQHPLARGQCADRGGGYACIHTTSIRARVCSRPSLSGPAGRGLGTMQAAPSTRAR